MSRIGKKLIKIPDGVTVSKTGNVVKAKGAKGELECSVHPNISVEIKDGEITVKRPDDTKENKALHGLTRALIQNMIVGVTDAYTKTLDIVGVGYRAELHILFIFSRRIILNCKLQLKRKLLFPELINSWSVK